MATLKILHVITSLRTGGAEHLMVDLLPRLQKDGNEVELLLFDGTRTPFYEQLEHLGIRIHSLSIGKNAMHNPWLVFRLHKYLTRYDVIHTHNTSCQLLVAIASYFAHVTLFTTEHNTANRRRNWKWYRCIDRWMYSRYNRIVCVSKEVERRLAVSLDSPRLSARMITIPNGIDVKRFAEAKPDEILRKQYPDRKLIIMVAAFRPQKDQPTLIKAMTFLPQNYHLLLVGDGECRNKCEGMIQDLSLRKRVHFLGVRTDIPSLMKAADAIVLSSHYEGLSLSSIEGLASGIPVIASDVPGLREIVGGAGLLFQEENSHQLVQKIQNVCEDQELRAQVAAHCQQHAALYDVTKMANQYLLTYQQTSH